VERKAHIHHQLMFACACLHLHLVRSLAGHVPVTYGRRGRREKSGCIGLVGDCARARDVRGWDELCAWRGVA
jgi:hypothetical protein